MSLVLFAQDAESFQTFSEIVDCEECHGDYGDPPFNCATCHTIFSGGPSSNGHAAHLSISLQQTCNTCHVVIGDEPLMSKCTTCHLKNGLIKHHFGKNDTGLCWMCHNTVTPLPEDTKPIGYEGTCLNTCDGSEELFSSGSFTLSLDNDGDLLVDNADPDCFICTPTASTLAIPNNYVTLQDAFDNAIDNETIMLNNQNFIEDLYFDLEKTVYIETGYDCLFASIVGDTTLEGTITIGPGALVIQSGALVVKTPEEDCTDGVDNDGDGLISCNDPDCDNDPVCLPASEVLCGDCVDNDNDGLFDCYDPDCSGDPTCPAPSSCTDCHGSSNLTGAPEMNGDLVGVQDTYYPVTGHSEGAHVKHSEDQWITDCNICHNNNGMPAVDQVITIAFTGTATANSSSPSYDGKALSAPYSYNAGVTTATGTQDCSNVYCHSSVQGAGGTGAPAFYSTPDWDAVAVTCDSCHGQDPDETDGQPNSGSHDKHAGSQTGEQNYDCAVCHFAAGSGTAVHINNTINSDIDNTYGISAAYSQGDHAPGSGGYGTCSNVSCHDDGLGTSLTTPEWGTPTAACTACHEAAPVTGSHSQHLAVTGIDCNDCHDGAVQGTTAPAQHLDSDVDVFDITAGDLGYPQNVAKGSQTWTSCTTASCHSDGNSNYRTTPAWGSAGTGCNMCHDALPTTGAHAAHVKTAAVAYGSTSVDTTGGTYDFGCGNCHPSVESGNHRDGNVDITLNSNHGGTLKSLNNVGDNASGYAQTQGSSVTCSAAYCHSKGDGTFDVTSPDWYGGSVSGSCNDCHGNSPSTNAHGKHVVGIHYYNIYTGSTGLASVGTGNTDSHGSATYSTTINCDTCHSSTVDASANDQNTLCATCHGVSATLQGDMAIAAGSGTHLNGLADVALNAVSVKSKAQLRDDITTATELNESWDRTASGVGYKAAGAYDQANSPLSTATGYNATYKSCASIACHNGNSAEWSDTGMSCSYCHSDLANSK